jgi:hypothetical protein
MRLNRKVTSAREGVCREREERGAVEVDSHGQKHDEFCDEADEEEFERPKRPADDGSGEMLRFAADERLQVFAPDAEEDAELREARVHGGVEPKVVEVAAGAGVGEEAPLTERDRNVCDGDDGEEGHLKARLEES